MKYLYLYLNIGSFIIPFLFSFHPKLQFYKKSGYKIFNLPIEEWLFFICIPYACLFTYHSLRYLLPNLKFSLKYTTIIHATLVTAMIICLWYFYDRWYTFINFCYTVLLLGLVYNSMPRKLGQFLPSFFIILLPFLLVNGVLTGSFIEDQVVWYDNTENMGVRIFTIPIEDSMYALGMLLTVYVLMEYFENKNSRTN